MKYIALLFGLVAAANGASWDGTKGNITVSTTSTAAATTLTVSSSDSTVSEFIVVAWIAQPGFGSEVKIGVAVATVLAGKVPVPARITFQCAEDQIASIMVTEVHPGQVQTFTGTIQ